MSSLIRSYLLSVAKTDEEILFGCLNFSHQFFFCPFTTILINHILKLCLNMRRFCIWLIVLIVSISCSRVPDTVNIGFKIKLIASQTNVLPYNAGIDSLFTKQLKTSEFPHFLGKSFLLFDTIYTSTITTDLPVNYSGLFEKDVVLINENDSKDGQKCFFYHKSDFYIYRTLIPENEQKQVILADIASQDSAKISRYFSSQKLKQYITE